jgi:hypothetical protein
MDNILETIQNLFESTPDETQVALSYKIKDGVVTDEICIGFRVAKKKQLSELLPEEVLPSEVFVNGKRIKTDVLEVGTIEQLSCVESLGLNCDDTTCNSCFDWLSQSVQNKQRIRPIVGGISLTSQNRIGTVGTLGLLVVDNDTNCLLGLTNNHVVIKNPSLVSKRNTNYQIQNELNNFVYQDGENPNQVLSDPNYFKIGQVLKYVPLDNSKYNQVDGAVFSINSDISSTGSSSSVLGLSGQNSFLSFATTQEIDDLLIINPPVKSSGRTTGIKQGNCGLRITSVSLNTSVRYYWGISGGTTINRSVSFNRLIEFTRNNINCKYPVAAGDSGSVLIAEINGVNKIIGLVFAGSSNGLVGVASRIDDVASQLNITPWTGQTVNYVSNISTKTVQGLSSLLEISCNNQTFWQIGTSLTDSPC